ncbi:MAG TPA: PqiC family protein, partial [Thermoanaerobaculaceae bacterium]|nr:PqiC family protein [Thermoanaerobaculaceae bacterium]
MKTSLPRALLHLTLVAAWLAEGCLGSSALTRLYVLAATEGTSAPHAPTVSVGVGPVTVASYLDRPQIVTRPSADTIDLAEFDQWGEPLRDGISRVLAEDLSRQLPAAKVSVFPSRGSGSARYRVEVDVMRFDGPVGGETTLEARWRILDDASGKELAGQTLLRTEAA